MKTLYVLMSHQLSLEQEADAKASLGIESVVYPPEQILALWKNVPADASLWDLKEYLQPIKDWLRTTLRGNDLLLVQGESVSSYIIVDNVRLGFPLDNVKCIAATSCRDVVEEKQEDGSVVKKSIFRHKRFRAYYA